MVAFIYVHICVAIKFKLFIVLEQLGKNNRRECVDKQRAQRDSYIASVR